LLIAPTSTSSTATTAERGHDQRLQPGRTPGPLGRVDADQQVGEDRGQLPEHVQEQEVVGEDQAEHRAGEGDEVAREGGEAGVVPGEVPGAEDEDERADTRDDQHHHPLERPHGERQL
jgi:hypothetical protein